MPAQNAFFWSVFELWKVETDYKIEFTKLNFGFFPDFCRHIELGSTLNTGGPAYYVLHPKKGNAICIF